MFLKEYFIHIYYTVIPNYNSSNEKCFYNLFFNLYNYD